MYYGWRLGIGYQSSDSVHTLESKSTPSSYDDGPALISSSTRPTTLAVAPATFLERSIPVIFQARIKLQYLDRHKDVDNLSIFAFLVRSKPIEDEDGNGSHQHPRNVVEKVANDK